MSIIITNVGSIKTPTGMHEYILSINKTRICAFTHVREEGLSKCLRRAADMYDLVKEAAEYQMILKLSSEAESNNGQ